MATAAATALEDDAGAFVPALIAVLVYVAVIALAAMLLVGGLGENWQDERESRLTVQLAVSASRDARQTAVDRTLAAVREVPEVARAEPVPEGQLIALLQPWLSAAPLEGEVALPAVIDVQLTEEGRRRAVDVRDRLRTQLPDARIDSGGAAIRPAMRMLRAIEGVALLVVVVLGGTLGTTVVFATQARLAARRETIEILHLLGADEKGIVDAVVGRALRTAVTGAAVGLALAALTLLAFFWVTEAPGGELSLSPAGWAALSALPLAAVAIAAVTARLTARRALAAMP